MRPTTGAIGTTGVESASALIVQIPPDAPAGKPFRFVLASAHPEGVEKDTARVTDVAALPATTGEGHDQTMPVTGRAAAAQVAAAEPTARPSADAEALATPGDGVRAIETHPNPHLRPFHHRRRAGAASARAEARAVPRKPEPQPAPSLRDFLQHLVGQPRNAQKS